MATIQPIPPQPNAKGLAVERARVLDRQAMEAAGHYQNLLLALHLNLPPEAVALARANFNPNYPTNQRPS